MARVLVATQSWGVLFEKAANRALFAPPNGRAASINTTVYAALTGGTTVAFNANDDGELPGYVEPGHYTLTIDGVPVPVEAVSASIPVPMSFEGLWNASTNTPTLADATGTAGDFYRVSAAASRNLGSGSQTFAIGDLVVLDSTLIWRRADAAYINSARMDAAEDDIVAQSARITARPVHSSDYADLAAAVLDAGGINGPEVVIGPGTHNIDELVPTAGSTQTVGLRGQGYVVTKLKQTVDRGANTFAVKSAVLNTSQQCVISKLQIVGPTETFTVNTTPCAMEGVRMAGRMNLEDAGVSYFKANVRIAADHITLRRCVINAGYYNLLFKGASTTGDIHLDMTDLSGAAFASMGLAATGIVSGFQMYGGHIGFAPYGLYVETGFTADPAAAVAQAMLFDRVSFEQHGNGIVYDEDAIGFMQNLHFRDCGDFNLEDGRWIAARLRPALFRAGAIKKWKFTNTTCATLGGQLADRLFHAAGATSGGIQGMRFDVDLADMFGGYAAKRLFCQPAYPWRSPVEPGRLTGTHKGVIKCASAAVSKGRICESQQYQGSRHAVVAGTDDLLGVAYADALADDGVLLLSEGSRVPVFTMQNVAGAGARMCVDAADPSKAGSSATQAAQPVIGQHWFDAFTTSPALAEVDLRMPRG